LFYLILDGCHKISLGELAPEMIWGVFFAFFAAMGARGIISNICKLLITGSPVEVQTWNARRYA
jgi:hypothetical protein